MKLETKVQQTLKKIFRRSAYPQLQNKGVKNEKILVALSGGKDSTVTAYLLKKLGYNIEGFHINLGMGNYSEKCFGAVKKLCDELKIKLHIYDIKKEMGSSMCYLRTAIQSNQKKGQIKNCAICGVIKKWILNKEGRKFKVDKIATGHNLDDEAQTYLLNVLKGNLKLSLGSGPITKNVSDKKFIPRIKPLFYVAEENIRKFSLKNNLPVHYEKCPCATDSYRIQIRKFMNELSTKEKENLVKNSEEILKKIKRDSGEIKYCEICEEPSRNRVCRKCELISGIKR